MKQFVLLASTFLAFAALVSASGTGLLNAEERTASKNAPDILSIIEDWADIAQDLVNWYRLSIWREDPNVRMELHRNASEDLRKIDEEFRRIWFGGSTTTPTTKVKSKSPLR